MPNVAGAYCATEDLRLGDIRPPADTAQYVLNGAEEIDGALGSQYVTPIVIPTNVPAYRPSILMLKKINWLLGSGRAILDMAAAGENQTQHAYGMGMLKEGLAMLARIVSQEVLLNGAPEIPADNQEQRYTGPVIFNEDPDSLVKAFYERGSEVFPDYLCVRPQPYGLPAPRVL